MNPKALFELFRDAFKEWGEDKASRLAAALAYYTIFSIGPLLVVIIAIVGRIFGRDAVQGEIVGAIGGVVGNEGATMIQNMIASASDPGGSIIATIIGTATLLLGASGVFGQLKDSLNTIWGVMLKPGASIMATVMRNFLSFTMVLGTGFLLMVSLVINAALAALGDLVKDALPGGPLLWQLLNYGVMLAVITLLFAMIYKVLPDVKIAWSNVWIGALVTALLFLLGQIALGFYFGLSDPGSAFGAAGSLVLILVWIYYSGLILFFGAEITQVYARRHGKSVRPDDNAIWISGEARAQQGLKGDKGEQQRKREAVTVRRESPWFSRQTEVQSSDQ